MKYAEALDHNAKARREPKSVLESIQLKKADNGGVVASHRMTRYEGAEPVHAFGADEGHLLAAHLTKHLGIKMSGETSQEAEKEEKD